MRKFVFMLVLIPTLTINIASANWSVDHENEASHALIAVEIASDLSEKSEEGEKFSSSHFSYNRSNRFLSGHLLIDLYAVPPGRNDLPYEPPIAS